jgi:hypothetical protein
MTEVNSSPEISANEDRRKFLAACGKFAVVTPPAITMLLSTSLNSTAIANSGGRGDPGEHRDHDNDHDRDDRNEHRHRGKDDD